MNNPTTEAARVNPSFTVGHCEHRNDFALITDVAFRWRARRNCDGTETEFWVLKRPLGEHPAGAALPLKTIDRLLFP